MGFTSKLHQAVAPSEAFARLCLIDSVSFEGSCFGDICGGKTFSGRSAEVICPGDCNTCENAEVCTSCRNRALLYKGQCLKECPATHFPEISGDIGGECIECKGLCSECLADDNCTQCKPHGFLHGTSKKWLSRASLQHEGLKTNFDLCSLRLCAVAHLSCLVCIAWSRLEEDLRQAVPRWLLQGEGQENQ